MPKISGKLLLVDSVFLPRIADTPKTPLICPRIASNAFDVYLMPEAKIIALRCLKMRF